MGKPLPVFTSDEQAERFIDEADLSEYDLSGGQWVDFERIAPKGYVRLSVNLSEEDIAKAVVLAKEAGLELDTYLGRVVSEELRKGQA